MESKQGGVMSPLLFTIYIDVLLCRLRNSGYGCHIGNMFCGALGYADDVILLAPTVTAMNHLLDICTEYGLEYDVLFNPDKTKLIYFDNVKCNSSPNIRLSGKPIEIVEYDKHLGFVVGNVEPQHIISQAVNEFLGKVNMVKSHFKYIPHEIMYKLFKTYCMPLYGCTLWDFSNKVINKFYVAWRKAIRYILGLPRTTHCVLLHQICSDIPVLEQLYSRFINFIKGLNNSNNQVTNMCVNIALQGSNSIVSNNITIVSNYLSVSRYNIPYSNIHQIVRNSTVSDTAQVIKDLLDMKHRNMFESTFFHYNDIKFMIEVLCTS